MSETKKEHIEVNVDVVDEIRSKAYELCISLSKKEQDKYIKVGLEKLKVLLYGNLGRKLGLYEKIFEEYIEKEFAKKGIDFDKDDLNPIEDKFLTKKFVNKEFEEFVNKIINLDDNRISNKVVKVTLKALDKYRDKTIVVDGKKYTLWEVAIDTLLVDMNKFGAEDRNKFINKLKLNKLLEEITKEK